MKITHKTGIHSEIVQYARQQETITGLQYGMGPLTKDIVGVALLSIHGCEAEADSHPA